MVSRERIEAFFSGYGRIASIEIITNRWLGYVESVYGFLHYINAKSATKLLNDTNMCNKKFFYRGHELVIKKRNK